MPGRAILPIAKRTLGAISWEDVLESLETGNMKARPRALSAGGGPGMRAWTLLADAAVSTNPCRDASMATSSKVATRGQISPP